MTWSLIRTASLLRLACLESAVETVFGAMMFAGFIVSAYHPCSAAVRQSIVSFRDIPDSHVGRTRQLSLSVAYMTAAIMSRYPTM